MKKEKEFNDLLNELAEKTTEPVHPDLCKDIKNQIPDKLSPHKGGLDSIKIIVYLIICYVNI